MPRYDFDPERAIFNVSTRPGMTSLGVKVVGASGHIEMTLHDDGTVDDAEQIGGRFIVTVGNIKTANQLVTAAALQFFGTDDVRVVEGTILGATRVARDRFRLQLELKVGERVIGAVGTAHLAVRANGDVEAMGDTMIDPRSFGLPLPPLVNLMIHTRWRVALIGPAPG